MKETIKLSIAAIVSMLTGSHCVYLYYKPMSDFGEYIKREEKKRLEEKLKQNN